MWSLVMVVVGEQGPWDTLLAWITSWESFAFREEISWTHSSAAVFG